GGTDESHDVTGVDDEVEALEGLHLDTLRGVDADQVLAPDVRSLVLAHRGEPGGGPLGGGVGHAQRSSPTRSACARLVRPASQALTTTAAATVRTTAPRTAVMVRGSRTRAGWLTPPVSPVRSRPRRSTHGTARPSRVPTTTEVSSRGASSQAVRARDWPGASPRVRSTASRRARAVAPMSCTTTTASTVSSPETTVA